LAGGALVILLAGCSGPPGETLLPVEGLVRLQGKPLTKGVVVLHADDSKGNTSKHDSRGNIQADGHYKISTHPREGAPPGWYKITVQSTEPSDPKNPYAKPRSLLPDPEKFGSPDESGLTFQVRPDAPAGAYDLELK
jgi:hypothetical protein